MSRAFEPVTGVARRPGSRTARTAPIHTAPPAKTFAQLANRLHLGTPVQLRVGAGPVRRFSGIAGPGRPPSVGSLPAGLRAQVEARFGLPMDDVRVHRDSPAPARLGALAYAQGGDIHLGPGQERHLPHEAWHVVQQKQGRVTATTQVGGVGVNDDIGLEQEADRLGGGPAARAAGTGSRPGRPGARSDPPPIDAAATQRRATKPVVQRAIGYEVELGTVAVTPTPGVVPAPVLAKGQVLWRGSGWDVSVDDAPGGGFDLELRTDPINDLVAGGRSTAQRRLREIASLWSRIETTPSPQPARTFSASAPANVSINAYNVTHNAQLQASAGLSLAALAAIRSGAAVNAFAAAQAANPHAAFVQAGGEANQAVHAGVTGRAAAIRTALNLPPGENIVQMMAVIGMIVELAVNAHVANAPYAKGMAGGLMARTNFATVLAQLPANQLAAIRAHPQAWRQELIAIALPLIPALNTINSRTPLFRPQGFPNAPSLGGRLKMATWFRDLAHGQDRLTQDDYRARHGPRPEAAELESLGSYGTRMDVGRYDVAPGGAALLVGGLAAMAGAVASGLSTETPGAMAGAGAGALMTAAGLHQIGRSTRNRPIFEFRALGSPDVQTLVPAGLALWDYVEMAHGHQHGGANALSTFKRLWNWAAS